MTFKRQRGFQIPLDELERTIHSALGLVMIDAARIFVHDDEGAVRGPALPVQLKALHEARRSEALTLHIVSIATLLRMADVYENGALLNKELPNFVWSEPKVISKNDTSMREACNKIIHAERYAIGPTGTLLSTRTAREGILSFKDWEMPINLIGTKQKNRKPERWTVRIGIISFLEEAASGVETLRTRGANNAHHE